jgi:uncharacterized YigZ family protein
MIEDFYTYRTIETKSEAEFKDRGSKFIAYVFPVSSIEEFKIELKKLKELHPKANHHCSAYRIGRDKLTYRASDDGEPSGSAGKPILGVIDSNELTNVAIVVVRYFGGTLLGVPGLINAYKESSNSALQNSTIIEKEETNTYELEFDYTITSTIKQALHKLGAEIISTENLLFCKILARIPKKEFAAANKVLDEINTLQYKVL